jgi:ATP-dependent DNA helicase RecG
MTTRIPAINRIVVGDVGSGKTIVGFLVGLSYLHGLDDPKTTVALLAPTEVLAWQHYQGLMHIVSQNKEDLDILFLGGKIREINGEKMTPKNWEKYLATSTKKKFWIGTHALLFVVNFQPQLIMVDEQHRFGVKQRQALTQQQAHYISFSATPIPRTLALTVYKYLEPLYLERLPGRALIETKLVDKEHWPAVEALLVDTIHTGKKAYVVCPQIIENETDVWSVTQVEEMLKKSQPKLPTIVIHGKQKDKKQLLQNFSTGEPAVLIATSVIEVGVDVADATLMVIVNAERFGLAALHQIRGRVGRNNYPNNQCLLVTEKHGLYNPRLQAVRDIHDGLELAQKDLELRGSGFLLGTAQSGMSEAESFIGLNPEMYAEIQVLVDALPDQLPAELARLDAYIEKTIKHAWNE